MIWREICWVKYNMNLLSVARLAQAIEELWVRSLLPSHCTMHLLQAVPLQGRRIVEHILMVFNSMEAHLRHIEIATK